VNTRVLVIGCLAVMSAALISGQSGQSTAPPATASKPVVRAQKGLQSAKSTAQKPAPASDIAPHRALVDQYCVVCHNAKLNTANLHLDELVLYGSNMGNSNQHLHYDVPHVLVGGANGKLKGGRHIAYPTKTVPTGNLLLSILDKFDIHQDSIGDSKGRLDGL
jgi:hypothetical protein